MVLEAAFIESLIIEAAKFRGQPTKSPDKSDLHDDDVDYESETGFLDKRETFLGFQLHLGKGISHCQKVRDQLAAAIRGKCKVTDPMGSIEVASYQIPSIQYMFRPRHDETSETHIGSSLITR